MDTIQMFHDSLPKLIVLLDFLSYLPEEVSVSGTRLWEGCEGVQ